LPWTVTDIIQWLNQCTFSASHIPQSVHGYYPGLYTWGIKQLRWTEHPIYLPTTNLGKCKHILLFTQKRGLYISRSRSKHKLLWLVQNSLNGETLITVVLQIERAENSTESNFSYLITNTQSIPKTKFTTGTSESIKGRNWKLKLKLKTEDTYLEL
jgi:hypothetical protein